MACREAVGSDNVLPEIDVSISVLTLVFFDDAASHLGFLSLGSSSQPRSEDHRRQDNPSRDSVWFGS